MKHFWLEAAGWYGMVAIVGAYAFVSFSILLPDSLWYQLLNITGSLGIIAVSYHKGVMQSVGLNVFWLLIAAVSLFRIFFI